MLRQVVAEGLGMRAEGVRVPGVSPGEVFGERQEGLRVGAVVVRPPVVADVEFPVRPRVVPIPSVVALPT